jgi:FG-GAP-like repeat
MLRICGALTVAICLFFSCASAAQQSYQTQRKLSGHAGQSHPAIERSQNGGSSLPKFAGWKAPQSLGRFSRSHRSSRLLMDSKRTDAFFQMSATVPAVVNPSINPVGFEFRRSEPAGFVPCCVVTGDFNTDGKLDFIVANAGDNTLWEYLGKGDGTFALPVMIPITQGQSPVSLAAADLRGNGKLDLVVSEADSNSIGVFLGRGDGTFSEGAIAISGSPRYVVVDDFNNDGKKDMAIGVDDLTLSIPNYITVLPGNGAGGFGTPLLTTGASPRIFFLSSADLNGDGIPDLLVSSFVDPVASQVWINQGNGTFSAGQVLEQIVGASQPLTSVLFDADGDGKIDAIVGTGYGVLNLFRGNRDGTFSTTPISFGVGDLPFGLAVVDVDGDGNQDLIASGFLGTGFLTGSPAGNLLSVLRGDGKGNFGPAKVYRGDVSAFSLALGDFNGDGHIDVVTANQDSDSAVVFLNDATGGFGDPQGEWIGYAYGSANAPITDLISVDVNGDGFKDLALLEHPSQTSPNFYQLTTMLNDKAGHFLLPVRSDAVGALISFGDLVFADFRNTGKPDFLAIGSGSSNSLITFAANAGLGSFGPPAIATPSGAEGTLAVGDFNGDGKLDFVAGNGDAQGADAIQITFFAGQGNGAFRPGPSQAFGGHIARGPGAIYPGDFNRDGKLDVLVFLEDNGGLTQVDDLYELLGNGDGSFQPAKLLFSNFGPMTVADIDHDGYPDIVQASYGTALDGPVILPVPAEFSTYLGQSDGSFKLKATYNPYPNSLLLPQFYFATFHYAPMVADFNGDGNLDIAAFQQDDFFGEFSFAQILLGNGDGTFTPTFTRFDFQKYFFPHLAMDVNGDGKSDLVELDGYRASFHAIRSVQGPSFQLALAGSPVVGTQGAGLLTLAVPSGSSRNISLSASDAAVTVPGLVTIPAGQTSQEFPITIGAGFNKNHVFSITGQLGTETEVAYGYQLPAGAAGFLLKSAVGPPSFPDINLGAGQTTGQIQMTLQSVGGYEAPEIKLSCVGLPVHASCLFFPTIADVNAGFISTLSFKVSVGSDVAIGSYPAKMRATDGILTQDFNFTLNVGDFTFAVTPPALQMFPNDNATYSATVTSVQKFDLPVFLTMSQLPADITRPTVTGFVYASPTGSVGAFPLQTQNAAVGSYTLTFTGSSLPLSHSASAQLQIWDFSGSVSPGSGKVKAGSPASFTLALNSVNGFNGTVTLRCLTPTALLSCTFSSSTPTIPAGGSTNVTVTLLPSSQLLRESSNSAKPSNLVPFNILGIAVMGLIVLRGSKVKATPTLLVVLIMLGFSLSCGGGGSVNQTTPPPPPPKSYTVTIQAPAGTSAKTLGEIVLTVD